MVLFETHSIPLNRPGDQAEPCAVGSNQDSVTAICKSPEKLQSVLKLISAYKSVHYVSQGDWSMHDITMELLKRYGPAELFISTYALREFSVRQIVLAQERKELTAVHMILDYMAPRRIPEVFQLAKKNLTNIYLTKIHAKVTVIRGVKGSVAIVGSANWTTNPRVECGVITMDNDLVEFHIGWMQNLMNNVEIFK